MSQDKGRKPGRGKPAGERASHARSEHSRGERSGAQRHERGGARKGGARAAAPKIPGGLEAVYGVHAVEALLARDRVVAEPVEQPPELHLHPHLAQVRT